MKAQIKIIAVVLSGILFICSGCGHKTEIEVIPSGTKVAGDLENNLSIVNGTYKVTKGSDNILLTIRLIANKAIDQGKEFDDLSAELLDESGMPLSGVGKFRIGKSMATEDDNKKVDRALTQGSGEVVVQLHYNEFNGEEAFKIASDKAKKFAINTTTRPLPGTSSASSSDNGSMASGNTSSVDCDKFIRDYESFVNSYVKLLKKYKANPTDASILAEYTEAAQKASEMESNAAACTDPKYSSKILDLNNKIAQAAL